MKLVERPLFLSRKQKWEFILENEAGKTDIRFSKPTELQYDFHGENNQKEIEDSFLFKETMERIEKWEEKMKEEQFLRNIQLKGKKDNIYLFYIEMEGYLAHLGYVLGDNDEKTYNQMTKQAYYLLLPLEKKVIDGKIVLCLNEEYQMKKITFSSYQSKIKVNVEKELDMIKKYSSRDYHFFTHRSFLQDIADKVNEHPTVRIKILVE